MEFVIVMQNSCFLFRDRASICQVNQQVRAEGEKKKREKQAPKWSHSLPLPSPVWETNKQTQNNSDISTALVFLYKVMEKRENQTAGWVTEGSALCPPEIIRLGVLGQGGLWGGLNHDISATVSHLKGHDPEQTLSPYIFPILKSTQAGWLTVPNKWRKHHEIEKKGLNVIWFEWANTTRKHVCTHFSFSKAKLFPGQSIDQWLTWHFNTSFWCSPAEVTVER